MKFVKKFQKEEDVKMLYNPNVVLVKEPRKILYDVAAPKGVFIQHVDGEIYTTTDWIANGFTNEQANGVAVIAEEARFVIAKIKDDNIYNKWAVESTPILIEGIVTTKDESIATLDFAGKSNTEAIIAQDSNTTIAAYKAASYTFPNGQKGYLPALGELAVMGNVVDEVEQALLLVGGDSLKPKADFIYANILSSTQYDQYWIWYAIYKPSGLFGISAHHKANESKYNQIRPFTTL